jgi:hypothetical protein
MKTAMLTRPGRGQQQHFRTELGNQAATWAAGRAQQQTMYSHRTLPAEYSILWGVVRMWGYVIKVSYQNEKRCRRMTE